MTNEENDSKTKPRSMLSKISNLLTPKRSREDNAAVEQKSDAPQPAPPAQTSSNTNPKGNTAQKTPAKPDDKGMQEAAPSGSTNTPKKRRPQRRRRPTSNKKDVPAKDAKPDGPEKEIKPAAPGKTAKSKGDAKVKLLINADEPEECRIALLEDGRVESFHVETVVHAQTKGNIYKGVITAVEPSLQAAFVDIGTGKNGFLPFGDIHPEYYCSEVAPDTHWKKLNIEKMVKKGQEVMVEVVKEATGSKGASMTTYLSLPGRYLVLMPGSDSAGISRKIEGEEQRSRLREIIESFHRPEGIGYIVRTASKDITKTALGQDIKYLLNLWKEIKSNGQSAKAPALIYKEQNIISRFLRDHFTQEILEILVDDQEAFEQVQQFLDLMPTSQKKPKATLYQGSKPLFDSYEVEKQIEQIYHPTVQLPSGGSIVINPTEALVAIDVNSGRTAKDKSFDETIFLANTEAAVELARQLRLRDLGGLVVVDFIDMRDKRHIREVEKQVKTSMKRDKAKVDLSRISKFGLMQISRQKMASPIQRGNYTLCTHCQGRGAVQSVETLALAYLRRIQGGVSHRRVQKVECRLPLDVTQYLLNKKRPEITELEKRYNVSIHITADPSMTPQEEEIKFLKQ